MSYKVKPEDVTPALRQDIAKRLFDHHILEWEVASIINAAIEAGLVSPPCHVLTRNGGYVIDHGYDGAIRVWPGKAYGPNVEHYKGQEA